MLQHTKKYLQKRGGEPLIIIKLMWTGKVPIALSYLMRPKIWGLAYKRIEENKKLVMYVHQILK